MEWSNYCIKIQLLKNNELFFVNLNLEICKKIIY